MKRKPHYETSIAGDFRNVSTVEEVHTAPFCLRLRRAYRTPTAQAFRDTVAAHARLPSGSRKPKLLPQPTILDFCMPSTRTKLIFLTYQFGEDLLRSITING